MNGLVVCVNFWDLLAITLPRNARFFDEVLVVTTPDDYRTQSVVGAGPPNVNVYCTDVFTKNGATFNKGAAVEEGLDVLGREGWLCLFDADIVIPSVGSVTIRSTGSVPWKSGGTWPIQIDSMDDIAEEYLTPEFLYAPRRRNLLDPRQWQKYIDPESWTSLPYSPDFEFGGYFHLFHASDPALGPPPWYATNWRHAGGYDSDFIMHWPREKHLHLPFEVLHLGEDGKNWWGRVAPYLDGTHPTGGEAAKQRTDRMWIDRKQRGGIKKEKL